MSPIAWSSVAGSGAEAASDTADVRSPETYVGFRRAKNFASPGGEAGDSPHDYAVGPLLLNQWGLTGNWTVGGESAVSNGKDDGIVFRFHARDLHLVLGPGPEGGPVHFRVTGRWRGAPRQSRIGCRCQRRRRRHRPAPVSACPSGWSCHGSDVRNPLP